jgi:hypothetical protein
MERIKLNDTMTNIMVKMSEGNPGALSAICECLKYSKQIDPDDLMEGFSTILQLDSMGIYGTSIYVLYSDICEKDIVKFITLSRAVQLGLFNRETVIEAASRQDYSGKNLITDETLSELLEEVKAKLPNFNKVKS